MTKYPLIAQADARAHAATGKPIFERTVSYAHAACPNCAGIGNVYLSFVHSGPFSSPAQGKYPTTYSDGKWWEVETKGYPCPICTSIEARRRYLIDASGLLEHEHTWRLDYFAGKAGKEDVLTAGRSILAQCPRPVGWYLFYGNYGRGKSGALKSITAAAILADVSARYITADNILGEIRDTYGDDTPVDERDLLERYSRYQLLAVDEVDRIGDTAWSRKTLFTLLNDRYDMRSLCCTLLATNQDPRQMPAGFEYLASRMEDGARVRVGGADLRGKA